MSCISDICCLKGKREVCNCAGFFKECFRQRKFFLSPIPLQTNMIYTFSLRHSSCLKRLLNSCNFFFSTQWCSGLTPGSACRNCLCLGNNNGCRDWTRVVHIQGKYPPCYSVIAPTSSCTFSLIKKLVVNFCFYLCH